MSDLRYLAAACQTDFPCPKRRDEIVNRTGHMLTMIEQAVVGNRPFGTVKLVVFPEAFIPGYPDWVWLVKNSDGAQLNRYYQELVANSVF